MKKIRICMILLPLLFVLSCKEDPVTDIPEKGKGHLVINTNVEKKTRATSTTDLSTYFIMLDDGKEVLEFPFPESGVLRNIETGKYTVTVTSHAQPPLPAFDVQHYSGSAEVTVVDGERVPVSITLSQQNAGIMFNYDDGLKDIGLENLVPTVTSDEGALEYSGQYRTAPGYFSPGTVTITLENDGQPVDIDWDWSLPFELQAGQLWRITLYQYNEMITGSLKITVGFLAEEETTGDIYVSDPEEHIVLDNLQSVIYYSKDYSTPTASHVIITLDNIESPTQTAYTLQLEGYDEITPADEYDMSGYWKINRNISHGAFWSGFSPYESSYRGTYCIEHHEEGDKYWFATQGVALIKKENDNTDIKLTAVFRDYDTLERKVLSFNFNGPIEFKETVNPNFLPQGDCVVTGTPMNDGPATFDNRFLRSVPILQGWTGLSCNVYLKLEDGNLTWHKDMFFTGYMGFGLIEDPETGENVFIRKAPVKAPAQGVLDFDFTYQGQKAAVGVMKIDTETGEILEVHGDFYYDAILMQKDMETQWKPRNTRRYEGIRKDELTGKYELINKNYRVVDYQ